MNFKTPWQDEAHYIVMATTADIAEMVYYAKNQTPLPGSGFPVEVSEIKVPAGQPLSYRVTVRVAADETLTCELPMAAPIWDPSTYRPLVQALLKRHQLDVKPGRADPNVQRDLLQRLKDPRAETLAKLDVELSQALMNDFAAPRRHEDAALLLGAFTLREASGLFFQIRAELCRMAAHLAFAEGLRGGQAPGTHGHLAETTLLVLCNNQSTALQRLDSMSTEGDMRTWKRALRMRVTGDYRASAENDTPGLWERLESFRARAQSVNATRAWSGLRLPEAWQSFADWTRVTNESVGCSVELGHMLLEHSLAAEMREAALVFAQEEGAEFAAAPLAERFNAEPTRCVVRSNDGSTRVRIVGWGLWAAFLQRHVCHTIVSNFKFMHVQWGVPDQARDFRTKMDEAFGGLRLYPFVRRQCATDQAYYRAAQDDQMALVRSRPEHVPAAAWNEICYEVGFAPLYIPPPHAFVNEWHRHNPLPGTAYNVYPRMYHPSLNGRADIVAELERLHALAPYDTAIIHYLLYYRDGKNLTASKLEQGYAAVVDFCSAPCRVIAEKSGKDPAAYEKWMSKMALMDPSGYRELAQFYVRMNREDDAARTFVQWIANEEDDVAVANESGWLIDYLERTGQAESASHLADRAAATYSARGLIAKARLLERRRDYNGAVDLLTKMKERYEDPGPLIGLLSRVQRTADGKRFDALRERLMNECLPGGIEKFEVRDGAKAPRVGVRVHTETNETRNAGLRLGDIVVAVRGFCVSDWRSFAIIRSLELDVPYALTAWRDGRYVELKPLPPAYRFGVNLADYRTP